MKYFPVFYFFFLICAANLAAQPVVDDTALTGQIQPDQPEQVTLPVTESLEQAVASPPPSADPAIDMTPSTAPQTIGQQERVRSFIIMVAAGILTITLVTLIILLIKRSRDYKKGLEISASEAYLNDVNGYTAKPVYKLGKKATMLGRVAGRDSGHLDYIVIPESTIGRRHAVIDYKDYGYWIVDQGSINGTFVNDVRVNGDTRLKHGDRIRLHKFDFEFSMPDLEEAGVTKLSGTVVAAADADLDAIKADLAGEDFKLDFDFSGDAAPAAAPESDTTDRDEATLLPGYEHKSEPPQAASDDATLMPGYDQRAQPDTGALADDNQSGSDQQDATLMPGLFDDVNEDATIRPDIDASAGKPASHGDKAP